MLFDHPRYIRQVCRSTKHQTKCLLDVRRNYRQYRFEVISRVRVETKKRIPSFDTWDNVVSCIAPLKVGNPTLDLLEIGSSFKLMVNEPVVACNRAVSPWPPQTSRPFGLPSPIRLTYGLNSLFC